MNQDKAFEVVISLILACILILILAITTIKTEARNHYRILEDLTPEFIEQKRIEHIPKSTRIKENENA